ncbi:tumor necrosis factor ligand superfamily member 11-like [Oculina patagonica]
MDLRGFTHQNGRLVVQEPGWYFIYAQVFFETYPEAHEYHNRVVLAVNHVNFAQMQTGLGGGQSDYGTVYAGGVIPLQQGDYISLKTFYDSYLWMTGEHTYFGAFKI